MALPTTSKPKEAELIEHKGRGFVLKYPGSDERVPLENGHHHFGPTIQYQPPGDAALINAVQGWHGKVLPPALMREIAAAVAELLGLQNVHDFAGSDQAMPGLAPEPEGDEMPPDAMASDMGGGLPTGRMAA